MDITEINKRIQMENDRHSRKINKLNQDINKENTHHQREIEYLQNLKNKTQSCNEQFNIFEKIIQMALN